MNPTESLVPGTVSSPDVSKPKGPKSGLISRYRSYPRERQFLTVLLVLFVVKQIVTVVLFPPFTGHDEVVHYAYVRTVVTEQRIPLIPDVEEWRSAWSARTSLPGDQLPQDLFRFCRYVLDWNYCENPRWANDPPQAVTFGGSTYPHGWQYAGNHPPLYYVLLTPLYVATERFSPEAQQYVFRAAAIPIGMMLVVLTFLMAGLLFPRDRLMAMVAPTFVAFQTQVSYEAAMVNNDILLVGMFTLVTWLLIRGVRQGFTLSSAAVIGLMLGLGLLAKASMLTAVPLIAIAIVLGVGVRNMRRWLPLGALTAGVAALVCWPWYAYLYRTYGNLSALDQVKALQFLWAYDSGEEPSILDLFWSRSFAQERWRETWGEFGWRLIHLPNWLLIAIGLPLLIMSVAAIVAVAFGSLARFRSKSGRASYLSREQSIGLWLLIAVVVVAYGAMLQFGTTFRLTQARYYFNAIAAIAILVAFGLRTVVPERLHGYAAAVFLLCMIAANVLIYSGSVIPYWYLST